MSLELTEHAGLKRDALQASRDVALLDWAINQAKQRTESENAEHSRSAFLVPVNVQPR
jgi:hypothetical protein